MVKSAQSHNTHNVFGVLGAENNLSVNSQIFKELMPFADKNFNENFQQI